MGTHPIFESDFDCLTEQKVEIGKWDSLVVFVSHDTNVTWMMCIQETQEMKNL